MKKRLLSLLLVWCMVFGLCPATAFAANSNNPFTDVETADWFYDAAQYVYDNGMMNGTSSTTFSPDATTTRAMIVTILHRMENEPAAEAAGFTDVSDAMYYADAIDWAAANGIVNGVSAAAFAPDDPITREQMAAILYRYAQVKDYDVSASGSLDGYTDAPRISAYAVTAMQWANSAGLITGNTATTINPTGNATRAEVATILMRFCESAAGGQNPSVGETYTVTFDYNYGSKGTYMTRTVQSGEQVADPDSPTRSGYTFAGWYTGSSGGVKFDFDTAITEDTTLYARWTSNGGSSSSGGGSTPSVESYTVSFETNGGSTVAAQTVQEGMTAAEPEVPTKQGNTFAGWYVDTALTVIYDFAAPVTEDITLYAKWEETETPAPDTYFTVTFDSNEGSAVPSQRVLKNGVAVQPEAPAKTDCTFGGWYTDPELTAPYDFNTPVTADITLYAKWEENETPVPDTYFTVTFDSNGGSEVSPQDVLENGCAVRPADPIRTGYAFQNWYTDPELTTPYDFNTPVTANITLYAGWSAVDVAISIDTHNSNYEETDVRRTFTVSVTSTNAIVTEVSYTLNGSIKTESGDLGTDVGTFSVDVLLEDGANTFTVYATTEDGTTVSADAVVQYVSGHVFDEGWTLDEYSENGIILVPVYENGSDTPSFYAMTNVVRLYFTNASTTEEREAFIAAHDEVFRAKVGEKSALRMMQATLQVPLTDKTSLTMDEYQEEIYHAVAAYTEMDSILTDAEPELYYPSIGLNYVSHDTWGNDDNNDWWLEYIDADDAWEYDDYYNSDFLTDIHLGIVDNGFSRHSDLAGRIDGYATSEDSPDSSLDHGTHVAGIMAAVADNNMGLAGALHNNSGLIVADVFAVNAQGASDSSIMSGFVNTVEAGAKVINFSLGSSSSMKEGVAGNSPRGDTVVNSTSKQMGKLLENGFDFIVVQSAGNGDENSHGVSYWNNGIFCAINQDNCYETNDVTVTDAVTKEDIIGRILVVANLQSDGTLKSSSNGVTSTDDGDLNIIAAPGTNIYSTIHTNDYAAWDGTSMSAPIVSSVCGLVWSVNTLLEGNSVVEIVMNSTVGTAQTAASGTTHTNGGMGIVNALRAVETAIDSLPIYKTTVVDATTGSGISAKVVIRNSDGEPVGNSTGTFYSEEDGSFTFPKLPMGKYTLTVSADGYADNQVDCSVGIGIAYGGDGSYSTLTTIIPDIPLSPGMDDNYYRIILRWDETPRDLDSHLTATTDSGSTIHVYYGNKNPSPNYANLDRDDTSSYGPETITITDFDKLSNIAYAVHDYTNRSSTSSTAMSTSGAYVMVYKGNTLLQRFEIPVNREGTEWDVFAFDASGNIIPVNQIKNCTNPSDVLSNNTGLSVMSLSEAEVQLKDYELSGE